MLHPVRQDLRHALRSLLRSPGFALTALASLSLGIGACTVVFALVNAVAFRPLAYPEAERLVRIFATAADDTIPIDEVEVAPLRDWQGRRLRTLESLAHEGTVDLVLGGGPGSMRVRVGVVSGNYFQVAGVRPRAGRTLLPDDDRPGAEPAAVLDHALWTRRFSADREVLGRIIRLGGLSFTVVGVMPAEMPLPGEVVIAAGSLPDPLRPETYLGLARMREGATLQAARAELRQLARASILADPGRREPRSTTALSVEESARSLSRTDLWVLLGAVGLVFLIACANIANLFLVRATARGRELGIRAALGAGRGALVRQLVIESSLLTFAGGGLGLLFASWGKQLARVLLGARAPAAVVLDGRVLAFALALALLTGLAMGLAPLVHLRRLDVRDLLQEGGAVLGGGRRERFERNVLIGLEVALALLLLSAAVALVRSFVNYRDLNLGYDAERVVVATMDFNGTPYGAPAQAGLLGEELIGRLRGRPGVASAAVWRKRAAEYGRRPEDVWALEGRSTPTGSNFYYIEEVSPDFFRTLGIPVVRGRGFTAADGSGAPAVAVVTETAARLWWPGEDPLGKRVKLGGVGAPGPWLTVVGIVADVQPIDEVAGTWASRRRTYPLLFRPIAQSDELPAGWVTRCAGCYDLIVGARAAGETGALVPLLRAEIAEAAPDLPVGEIETLRSLQMDWGPGYEIGRRVRLLPGFAFFGAFLALLGLYGIVADAVRRRTPEIAIRMALGARSGQVIRTVVAEGAVVVLGGTLGGVAFTLAAQRLVSHLFYDSGYALIGTSGTDPLVLAGAAAAFLLMAMAASFLGARRAMRVDPVVALRSE